ncbi:MAG TPA: cytochrome b/b6 domain-containing protein [Candidatus Eisenbacteria bacterium]
MTAPRSMPRRRSPGALAWLASAFLLLALAARTHAAPANDACLMCHHVQDLARNAGLKGSLSVDARTFEASAHGALACQDCHRDARGANHAPKLAAVRCVSCHREPAAALAGSVHLGSEGEEAACRRCHGTHAVARVTAAGAPACATCHAQQAAEHRASLHGVARANGDTEASTCRDCHGPAHRMLRHQDAASPVNRANLATTCARCHADRALTTRRKITIPDAVQLFRDSVHGRSKRPDAATCNDCHESHNLRRATEPTSSIHRTNIPATCGHCHLRELTAYRASIHGTALARGVTATPVCTDCHGEHLIRGPHDAGSPVAAGHVTETCSRCHEATGIRETYGLPAGRLSSYRDSFHGLAARGGSPVVANCASCHGYHDVLPSSDPRSSVSPARLGETCGRCHDGADKRFRIGQVHVTMATASQPVPFWARRLYLWLIALTIGFMLLHNGADFVRKLRRSLSVQAGRVAPHAHAVGRWFERMTIAERIQHSLLAVSFFTLVYTGFALKFPEAYPFAWLARLESGYAWRSIVHRVAAVVMVTVSLAHVAYLFTKRGRTLLAGLLPMPRDAWEMLENTAHLFGLRRAAPRFGAFGYIEKAEYWALIWGTLVMTATGLLLWFENPALRVLPKWALDLATVVHYYEAWLAFLAIVVWHLYQNILNPDIYPMNWTWLTGRIPGWQMQHEHPREYDRLLAEEMAAAGAVSAEGEGAVDAETERTADAAHRERRAGGSAAGGRPAGE